MALAAYRGLDAMNSAETKPNEWELGEPCAGKPPARFDEGASHIGGLPLRGSLYSTKDSVWSLKSIITAALRRATGGYSLNSIAARRRLRLVS